MKLSAWALSIGVADRAHGAAKPCLIQRFPIGLRRILGGFKRSSQHDLCRLIGETGQAPLRVSSNQASFGAAS